MIRGLRVVPVNFERDDLWQFVLSKRQGYMYAREAFRELGGELGTQTIQPEQAQPTSTIRQA